MSIILQFDSAKTKFQVKWTPTNRWVSANPLLQIEPQNELENFHKKMNAAKRTQLNDEQKPLQA